MYTLVYSFKMVVSNVYREMAQRCFDIRYNGYRKIICPIENLQWKEVLEHLGVEEGYDTHGNELDPEAIVNSVDGTEIVLNFGEHLNYRDLVKKVEAFHNWQEGLAA